MNVTQFPPSITDAPTTYSGPSAEITDIEARRPAFECRCGNGLYRDIDGELFCVVCEIGSLPPECLDAPPEDAA